MTLPNITPPLIKSQGDPMLIRPKFSTAPPGLRNLPPAPKVPRVAPLVDPVASTLSHGSESGARRHRRNRRRGIDDPTCEPCRTAEVAQKAIRRARAKAKRMGTAA